MKDIFHISKLIIKKRIKGISDSEKLQLKEYYETHPFTKDIDFENLVDKTSEYSSINKVAAWEAVLKKTNQNLSKTPVPIIKQNWFKYAVAATVVLMLSLPFLLTTKNGTQTETPVIVDTVEDDMIIGVDKATLTLEDGSTVTLEEGQTYSINNIQSNGAEIIYKPMENTVRNNSKVVYNYLTIPRGGQYYIELEDGTKVWLNSESKLKYPVAFVKGQDRNVELLYGEAYFDVSPSINHEGASFNVLSGAQEIEVLGTEFNVKAYHDEDYIYTTLVEGKVTVDNAIQKETLKPSEQSVLSKDSKSMIITEVDVFTEISWKNGFFSFRRKPLKDIMKVLSRWYDVDILFLNKELEGGDFKGNLNKNQSLNEILTIIKNTKYINTYEINNKTVLIK